MPAKEYDGRMPNKVVSLALSTHPGPAVAVTLVTVVLGLGVGLDGWRVALLGVAMLANQASVGLSNDWIDAERDRAVGRTDKPVARGWVSPGAVRTAAFATAVASVLLTLPLGWGATLAQFVFIASAWSYNAGLKKTALSVLPYVISFGLLSAIVTLSLTHPAFAQPWALAMGALLGIAAHFANVLPDLADDAATGVRGLPHRLGRRTVAVLSYAVLAVAALIGFLGVRGANPAVTVVALLALVANAGIAAVGVVIAVRPTRWHFRLIIASAIIDVVVLALAGERLLLR